SKDGASNDSKIDRFGQALLYMYDEFVKFPMSANFCSSRPPWSSLVSRFASAGLYAIGIALITTAEQNLISSGEVSLEDALSYRDGLFIALLSVAPLRRRTLTALTISKHLVNIGACWLLDIPAADTKTGRPLEFPLPDGLSGRISLYLDRFRS